MTTTLDKLQAALAAMLDPLDIPGDWTPRRRDAYETERCILINRVNEVRRAREIFADVAPRIAANEKWLADANAIRKTLCDELLAETPRARTDIERARLHNRKLSIQCLDRGIRIVDGTGWALETLRLGALLRESGWVGDPLPWHGAIPEVEQWLRELRARRDDAQRRLAEALREPEPATVAS